jgi:hypothetical protein
MTKTAKAKPTGAKVKKSTRRGKSNTDELPSSPWSRADRAALRGAVLNPPTDVVELNPTDVELNPTDVELNPTDVAFVDSALSAVNPPLSEINSGDLSPARATPSQAKNAIGGNNFYDSDSDDEDYRGDVSTPNVATTSCAINQTPQQAGALASSLARKVISLMEQKRSMDHQAVYASLCTPTRAIQTAIVDARKTTAMLMKINLLIKCCVEKVMF